MDPVPAKLEVRSFTSSWDNTSGYLKTLGSPGYAVQGHPSLQGHWFFDFGTNRKRICDFLLVRHSKLGPILHRFGDIVGFCAPEWPHPYSTLILWVFPLHQISHVGVSPKLFDREIIFKIFQPA